MVASERYKAYIKALEARAETEPYKLKRRLRFKAVKMEKHYRRAKHLEETTDQENRVFPHSSRMDIFEGKYIGNPIDDDPVYQILTSQELSNPDKAFKKIRNEKYFDYKNNLRGNKVARDHKEFFRSFVYEQIESMQKRQMNEETYHALLENGLRFAYEKSKERVQDHRAFLKKLFGNKD